MLIFVFTIVKPKEEVKVEAAVITSVLIAIVSSIVVEIAIDKGITWVNETAKKKYANNVAGKFLEKYGDEFVKLKPTKKNLAKWIFKAPKWVITAISGLIGGTVAEVIEKDKEKEIVVNEYTLKDPTTSVVIGKPSTLDVITVPSDPFYNTQIHVRILERADNASNAQASLFYKKYIKSMEFKPIAFGASTELRMELADGHVYKKTFSGGSYVTITPYGYAPHDGMNFLMASQIGSYLVPNQFWLTDTEASGGKVSTKYVLKEYTPLFEAWKERISNNAKTIYEFEGVIVEEPTGEYITVPIGMTVEQLKNIDYKKLPQPYQNDWEFEYDVDITYASEYEIVNEGSEFDWEILNDYSEHVNNYFGQTGGVSYNPVTNNNYYITETQQQIIDDVVTINPPIVGGGGGDVAELDGSIFSYIKNFYNYFATAISTSVDGFNQLNSNINSFMSMFASFFQFLPIEYRVLFLSGATMSVGLGVLHWGRR